MHKLCSVCTKLAYVLESKSKVKEQSAQSKTHKPKFTHKTLRIHNRRGDLAPHLAITTTKTVSPCSRCFWLFKCTNFSQHPQTLPQQKYATLHSWVVLLLQFAVGRRNQRLRSNLPNQNPLTKTLTIHNWTSDLALHLAITTTERNSFTIYQILSV